MENNDDDLAKERTNIDPGFVSMPLSPLQHADLSSIAGILVMGYYLRFQRTCKLRELEISIEAKK